jgi:chemotaxis methyl-accepting protein methylase
MNDEHFELILQFFGYSWSGYRKVRKGVKKRLVRHMHRLDCRDIHQYIDRLANDRALRNECERLLTVSISRFFRDKKLWEGLETQILPELIGEFDGAIRVLSAGCARGEEIYSFKILWDRLKNPTDLDLTAIDLNPEYIAAAQAGEYNKGSLKELSPKLIQTYFKPVKGRHRFAVIPELKTGIRWRVANLDEGLAGRTYHLIFLRNNILTYLAEEPKKSVFSIIMEGLLDRGWLIIGSHEKPPSHNFPLTRHPLIPWAYKKG